MKLRANRPKPKRRWWQHALRAVAAFVVLLALLYATSPWLVPKNWLARRIANDLGRQVGLPVTVDALSIGWAEGVRIDGLQIANPEGFGQQPLLHVRSIRAQFSPLRLLLKQPLEWAEVQSPKLSLALNAERQFNISQLENLPLGVGAKQTTVTQAVATLSFPNDPDRLRLDVANLQVRAGKVTGLGQITMSASVAQPSGQAPVGLTVLTGRAAGRGNALLRFDFGALDIGSLRIAQLLQLPLARLQGQCDGQLQCWVDPDGYVRDFNFELAARDLDVQPVAGPPLPVIDRALLRVQAAMNPLDQLVDLHSVDLQLPGLSLQGRAGLHWSALSGQWMALHDVNMSGHVNPAAVIALFRGRPEPLLGSLEIDGDVGLSLTFTQTDSTMLAQAAFDAAKASVRDEGRIVKPADQPAGGSIVVACKSRTWQVESTTELTLGQNRFVSYGSFANVKRILDHWVESAAATRADPTAQPYTLADLHNDISGLDWRGTWRITELDSLRHLHPAIQQTLSEVTLDGALEGDWRAARGAGTTLELDIHCLAGSRLEAGQWFIKSPDRSLELHAQARYSPDASGLREATVRLACGNGLATLALDRMELGIGPDDKELAAEVRGVFQIDPVEEIAECFPAFRDDRSAWNGLVSGSFQAQLGRQALRLHVRGDLTQMRLCQEDWLDKARGQPASAVVNALWNRDSRRGEADLAADLPGAKLAGRLAGNIDAWQALGRLDVTDAAWLLRQSPWLVGKLRQLRLEGACSADVQAWGQPDSVRLRLSTEAGSLALQAHGRAKTRGTPMGGSLDVTFRRGDAQEVVADLASATAVVDRCAVSAAGKISLTESGHLKSMEITGLLGMEVSPALTGLLPEFAEQIRRSDLTGGLSGEFRLSGGAVNRTDGEAKGLQLAAELNGDALSWSGDLPVAKPAGLRGRLAFAATVPLSDAVGSSAAEPMNLTVNHYRLTLGAAELLGGANATLVRDSNGAWRVAMARTHARAWTARAEELPQLFPALAGWAPQGELEVAGEAITDEQGPRLLYADATLENCSVNHRARRLSVSGSASVEGLRVAQPGQGFACGRLVLDDFHLVAGPSDVHLFADLRDLSGSPRGQLTLLAEQIDCDDLRQWLSPQEASVSNGQAPPLEEQGTRQLAAQADGVISSLVAFAAQADLNLSASVRRVRNFPDAKVRQKYDVDDAWLNGTVSQGTLQLVDCAGLFGGTIYDRYEIDLRPPADGRVHYRTEATELQAHAKLQPQVEAFFPGNEVQGSMTRTIDVTMPLRDFVMNLIDDRHPITQSGTGNTVFVRGLTRGRAAPGYVTAVFPGLNLVEYHYDRMESFSTYLPDGSAENDMIFSGNAYDMYINGATDPQQLGRYEIGVILLGSRQSAEWNHRFRQGRIPVLNWDAQIIGGQKLNERVSYPWPTQTAFKLFLENNIFYRLWLDSRRGRPVRP